MGFLGVDSRFRVEEEGRFDLSFNSAALADFDEDRRCGESPAWMNEADALGLERARFKIGDQLGGAAGGKNKGGFGAMTEITAGGGREIGKGGAAVAARDTAADIRTLPARMLCAIGRIRDQVIERCGRDLIYAAGAQVGGDCGDSLDMVERGVARGHRGEFGLELNCHNFPRMRQRGDDDRDDAASGAQFEQAIALAGPREASEQDRIDREAITANWLDDSQRTA